MEISRHWKIIFVRGERVDKEKFAVHRMGSAVYTLSVIFYDVLFSDYGQFPNDSGLDSVREAGRQTVYGFLSGNTPGCQFIARMDGIRRLGHFVIPAAAGYRHRYAL